MTRFFLDGKVSVDKWLAELERRALILDNQNFTCSHERFKSLAGKLGRWDLTDVQGAREAMAVLQGKIEGYYKNVRRENYGSGIQGPDFIVEGLDEYADITHVDTKNPVGRDIKKIQDPAHPPRSINSDSKE